MRDNGLGPIRRHRRQFAHPMRLAGACLAVMLVCLWPLPMRAEPPPNAGPLGPLPAGWTTAVTDVIAVFSTASPNGSVTIVAPAATMANGDIRSAIIELAPALIEDMFGGPRPGGEPVPLPASDNAAAGLMIPFTVTLDDGDDARIEVTGYPLQGKRMQLFFIVAPAAMADDDALLSAARGLVDRWRADGLAVTADLMARNEPMSAVLDTRPAVLPLPATVTPVSPDDSVENVIHFLRFTFDGGKPEAAGEPVSLTALLLKDGRVFEGEARAPADFDPDTRPPGTPGTGRWQRDGEAYAVAFGDGTQGTAVAGPAKTVPAPAALMLSGRYVAVGGAASDVLADAIDFYSDGSLLLKGGGRAASGSYEIGLRTARIRIAGQPQRAFVFGMQGEASAPELLIIGTRVYERAEAAR